MHENVHLFQFLHGEKCPENGKHLQEYENALNCSFELWTETGQSDIKQEYGDRSYVRTGPQMLMSEHVAAKVNKQNSVITCTLTIPAA